ncbi:MAG: glycosyltransferase family 4 protein, partial [Desulfurella sp.]
MKIALVTDEFKVGGGLEHIYQVAKAMENIEFFIFAKGGETKGKFKDFKNVSLISSGYHPDLVLQYKPDIIHIHHLKPLFSFYKLHHTSFYEIPIIFTAHGMHIHKYEFFKEQLFSKIKYHLRFNLEKYLFSKVSKVISVSKEDRDFIVENYRIDSRKIEYITNGVDFSTIDSTVSSKKELRKKLNLPEGKYIFLTIAGFDFQKGYDILLQSIKTLQANYDCKDMLFVFVGDGKTLNESKKFAIENNLTDLLFIIDAFWQITYTEN